MKIVKIQIKKASLLLFGFIFCFAGHSHAFETFPEYQFFSQDEENILEDASLLDSEVQSDVLSYSKEAYWEYLWLTRNTVFDGTVGSLGHTEFHIENRFKAYNDFSSFLQFRFLYFDRGNFEYDDRRIILEMLFRPFKKLHFAVYGQTLRDKKKDDFGLALIFEPHPRHYIRFYNTWADFNRNGRNLEPDRFLQKPAAYGFTGRTWSGPGSGDSEFFEYSIRYEPELIWRLPDRGIDYTYSKKLANVYWREKLSADNYLNTRLQYDQKFEQNRRHLVTSTETERAILTDRWLALIQHEKHGLFGSKHKIRYGLNYTHRAWLEDTGKVIQQDWVPHIWWHQPGWDWASQDDEIGISLDLTWHRVKGDFALKNNRDQDGHVEGRLNTTYDFTFKKAIMKIFFTFDLERFGGSDFWEGGNIQIHADF